MAPPPDGAGDAQDQSPAPLKTAKLRERFSLDPPSQDVGPYRLLSKIGQGGFGEVWVADRNDGLKLRVALKLIKPGWDSDSVVARFEQERQALARMNHEGIAQIFDSGLSEQHRPFFVMEYVDGEPITEFCDRHSLGIRARLELFGQVCEAVHHAHTKGIVHRDLKPSNILAFMSGKDEGRRPRAKVIDFGIAKALHGPLTDKALLTGKDEMIGTPDYMSPEQADPGPGGVDTLSDVYSLGVVLYELLTGSRPFEDVSFASKKMMEIRDILLKTDPPTPSTRLTSVSTKDPEKATQIEKARGVVLKQLARDLRRELEWIPLMAMRKEPKERYQTALALREDIQRYLKNEPIIAKPQTAIYKLQKFYSRNRTITLSATAGMATIFGLSAIAFVQEGNANREASAAKRARDVAQQERQAAVLARNIADQKTREIKALLDRQEEDFYIANIQIAEVYLKFGQIQRVRKRLEACPKRFRENWEWRWINSESDNSYHILKGHEGVINSAAFSPDSCRIITASRDKTARVWDAESGKSLTILVGHSGPLSSATYSPNGRQIVTASRDQTARIWDAESGTSLITLVGHSSPLSSATYFPNGLRILTTSEDQTARVWDSESGNLIFELPRHPGLIVSTDISADGIRIVTGCSDGITRIWESGSGKLIGELTGDLEKLSSATFSPDGRRILTTSEFRTGIVWDVESKTLIKEFPYKNYADPAVFSHDGKSVLTVPAPRNIEIINYETDSEISSFDIGGKNFCCFASFSPNDKQILLGLSGGSVATLDIRTGSFNQLNGNYQNVKSATYSPDGRKFVTISEENTARIWLSEPRSSIVSFDGHSGPIRSATLSPDGTKLITASEDKVARVWDCDKRNPTLELKGHSNIVAYAIYSPNGRTIVTASRDKTARIWDAGSGLLRGILIGHSGPLSSAAFSPDSRYIATGSEDKTARVWDALSGKQILELKRHSASISSVAFSPDGRRIVTASADATAQTWDAKSGEPLLLFKGGSEYLMDMTLDPKNRTITLKYGNNSVTSLKTQAATSLGLMRTPASLTSVAFSPNGELIVTGHRDKIARIWKSDSGTLLSELKEHSGIVSSAAFSPDGLRIVTACNDNTIRIWDAKSATPIAELTLAYGPFHSAAFSPDGQRIVIASDFSCNILNPRRSHEEF